VVWRCQNVYTAKKYYDGFKTGGGQHVDSAVVKKRSVQRAYTGDSGLMDSVK
jgi:hypothetical protein